MLTQTEVSRAIRSAGISCTLTFWHAGKFRLRQNVLDGQERTPEMLAAEILAALPNATIRSAKLDRRPWPKVARIVMDITLPQAAR